MVPNDAAELELPEAEVDDEELAQWGLDGVAEEEEEDDDETATSPEPGDEADPADGSAQVEPANALPGEATAEPAKPSPPASPSDPSDRSALEGAPREPAQEEPRPFTFKADGKEVTVPRSQIFDVQQPDGTTEPHVLFPLAEVRGIQHFFADRGAWREEKKQLLQQLAERDPEHHSAMVQARELTGWLWQLLDQSDEEILAAVEQMRSGRPAWEARQEAEALKRKLDARESVQVDPDPELQRLEQEEQEQQLQGALNGQLDQLLKQPEFAGVPRDRVARRLWELRHEVFFEADADLPQAGLRKGDIGINLGYLRSYLADEAATIRSVRESAIRAQQIERQNREALGTTTKPKPAVKTATRPARLAEEEDFDVEAFLNSDSLD